MKLPLSAACTAVLLAACGAPATEAALAPDAIGLTNFASPLPDVHTSGQPTEAQFDRLAKAGIRRVVHLRATTEQGTGWEEQRAAAAGVEFVRMPVSGKEGLSRDNVERFAKELQAAGGAPILVSCASSNRVGALFALKAAWIDGKSVDDALALGRAAGLRGLEPTVKELLQTPR